MRVDLPQCNLKTCRYSFDYNCTNEKQYKVCEYAQLQQRTTGVSDLIEQKHGTWIYKHDEESNTGNAHYECSVCGAGDLHAKSQEVPYCWKCGAKMELKEWQNEK